MGHSGSGKSYFVKNLLEKESIVRLNSDALRVAVYGPAESHPTGSPEMMLDYIFRALDYATKQVLNAGYSVIRDSNHNKRHTRQELSQLATDSGAVPVVIWIKSPKEVAIKRAQEREVADDQRKYDEAKATEVVERHIANTEEPNEAEKVIVIDGTVDFSVQYESFKSQLETVIRDEG